MHQVDPAGDRLGPVDHVDQVLTGGEGVAGVQAEPDAELADRVPEPGQRVELAGHRVVAARGVLDEHRHREAALALLALDELAPVVHPGRGVLARGDVPAVHHQPDRADLGRPSACWTTSLRDGIRIRLFSEARLTTYGECTTTGSCAAAQLLGLGVGRRLLPALRIGQEHLHDVGATLGRRGDRVVLAHVGPDEHAASVVTGPDGSRPRHRRPVGVSGSLRPGRAAPAGRTGTLGPVARSRCRTARPRSPPVSVGGSVGVR